jgi:DNA-directed RNA polymerase subunit M/transcription elongation factor TFIIS
MADTAVASGLLPHQKDEDDIWVCKDCGWKYPNAKPSAKIRKNHKKHCTGKAGAETHAAGGSSDEASDDEHHHTKGKVARRLTTSLQFCSPSRWQVLLLLLLPVV